MSEVRCFETDLKASHDPHCAARIKANLRARFHAVDVRGPCDGEVDRAGTDYWVDRVDPLRSLSIDVKVRSEDYAVKNPPRDDLALETWSIVETKKIGWTRDPKKHTDFVFWFWKDTGRYLIVAFPPLCKAFAKRWEEWLARYPNERQTTYAGAGARRISTTAKSSMSHG